MSAYQHINIETLIPQRPPMRMIDTLLYCDSAHTETSYTVPELGLFTNQGQLSATGLVENMAQTAAARMGYLALHAPGGAGKVRIGVIGSIKNLSIEQLPSTGVMLQTSVDLLEEIGDMIMVKAQVKDGHQTLAFCNMVVSLI